MTWDFLLTALIVVVVPGTGVLYTVAVGLTHGARAGVSAAGGCTLGIVPHITASVLGLAAVLHASAVAFQVVKFAGVAYLFYLAWSMWRAGASDALPTSEGRTHSHMRIAVKGFLINILNPKLSIFFLAFLPQFIDPHAARPLVDMGALSLTFMVLTLTVFAIYGVLAAQVRTYVLAQPRIMGRVQKGFAGVFALLGLKLAFTDR